MKRFSTVSFRYQLHRAFVAAMLGVAALALLGKAAHAQACGDPEAVPEAVFFSFDELLGELFPLTPEECEKIAKTGVAACHAAVSDSVQCTQSLFKSGRKARKTACGSLESAERAECIASAETVLDAAEADLENSATAADAVCDGELAGALSAECLGELTK
jgi:hypothetical protein